MTTTLPFSDTDYSKHDYAVFPTIRRRDKYGDVGDTVKVTHGQKGSRETIGFATIVAKETKTPGEMNWQFLAHDTESANMSEAMNSINKFYRNPITEDEELTVYWLKWVQENA